MNYIPIQTDELQPMKIVEDLKNCELDQGLQNINRPNIQPWPMSKCSSQQQRIHVSLGNDLETVVQTPLPLYKSVCINPCLQGSSVTGPRQLRMTNTVQQAFNPTGVLHDDNFLYSCNFIAQLQGSYEIDTSKGSLQVFVTLPEVFEQDEQYAIVNRLSPDGKALTEQRIYEEPYWFLLRSVNGKLEGLFRKGMNMKLLVK